MEHRLGGDTRPSPVALACQRRMHCCKGVRGNALKTPLHSLSACMGQDEAILGPVCQFLLACPEPAQYAPAPGVITCAHGMELEPPEPPRSAVMAPRNYLARPPAPPSCGGGPSSQSRAERGARRRRWVRESNRHLICPKFYAFTCCCCC
jgi:hypothetical protein